MGISVCIIPARGGSKGIPGKNILEIAGKPLLAWSIESALKSETLNHHVYVTSDSADILAVAEKYGAQPISRPDTISGDQASSESALIHAYDEIKKRTSEVIDYIVFLQATSPVRASNDVELALQKIFAEKADSLLSVQPLKDYFIWGQEADSFNSKNFDYKNRKRRQDIETTYLENGSIYIFKPEILLKTNNRLGGKITVFEMSKTHSQQIDEPEDFQLCEYFLKRSQHE